MWQDRNGRAGVHKKIFLGVLCVAGVALIATLVVTLVLGQARQSKSGEGGDGTSSGSSHKGELLIRDIYEGERYIPQFDAPANQYDLTKFAERNGYIQYNDIDAVMGVDVSEYQGDVDWEAVKGAGMDFAILRMGWRGQTEGTLNVDETFEANFENAKKAGLKVGAYMFSQAVSEEEAIAEAEFALETLNGRGLDYPLVFDWEPPIPSPKIPAEKLRAYNCTGEEVSAFAVAFCKKVKEAGYETGIYTNKSMAYEFFNLSKTAEYDLWYAEYQKVPSMYYDFRIWQYTENGKVPGIEGGADINICFEPY